MCADVPAHVCMCVWRPGSSAFTSEPSALLFDKNIWDLGLASSGEAGLLQAPPFQHWGSSNVLPHVAFHLDAGDWTQLLFS